MPCRDYESDYYSSQKNEQLQAQNDRLARIACKALTELVNAGKADFLLLGDDEVREWWQKHQEADRLAREEQERKRKAAAEKARKTKLRNEVLARLTPEEREALGVKFKKDA
jgi:hypothetical protein